MNGQWGPDTFTDPSGNTRLIGATATAPGYTCTIDALGNLTVTGPAAAAVSVHVVTRSGDTFDAVISVPPLASEITAAISASVAALVAGAPGALDTLNELATALADDANFASTVTTALAGKATAAQGAKADTAVQPAGLTAGIKSAYLPYAPDTRRSGTASTDAPTITTGVAADGTFNEAYSIASNTLPANWPIEAFGNLLISSNAQAAYGSQSGIATVSTHRFMADGTDIIVFMNAGFQFDLYIDGRPYASNPVVPAVSTGFSPFGFQKFVFGSAKPRLIELRGVISVAAVYTKKPYRLWKPLPDSNPSVAVVGDSYVAPTVLNDTTTGNASGDLFIQGCYQRMVALLGISKLTTDGIGGTGYVAGGGANMPYGHSARTAWLQTVNPNVVIVHGGGANDLFNSVSIANTVTAAVNYFTALHTLLPYARLVFLEGFAPPAFTPATYNPNYTTIRQQVQSALAAAGVPAYFLDLATTRPPINGSGYVTAANNTGNSDIYIGSDQTHLTAKGNTYARGWLAPKIARVLADDGSLVGSLI